MAIKPTKHQQMKLFHSVEFLDNLFSAQIASRFTRQPKLFLLKNPPCKIKIERCSIRFRAIKLFNSLMKQNILPQKPTSLTNNEISFIYHDLMFSYIHNMELCKYIFEQKISFLIKLLELGFCSLQFLFIYCCRMCSVGCSLSKNSLHSILLVLWRL